MTLHCSGCGAVLPHDPPVTCPACGAGHWRNAKPCAGALVVRDGRLLLVRRSMEPWLGWWDIPGGFCEEDEHPILALRGPPGPRCPSSPYAADPERVGVT